MRKIVFKTLNDVCRSYYDYVYCDGLKSFNFVVCEFRQSCPVLTLKIGVLCYISSVVSLVFGLLFLTILMKFVIERLPDVCHSYSDICDGSKDFDFVVCEFRSSSPFFTD